MLGMFRTSETKLHVCFVVIVKQKVEMIKMLQFSLEINRFTALQKNVLSAIF